MIYLYIQKHFFQLWNFNNLNFFKSFKVEGNDSTCHCMCLCVFCVWVVYITPFYKICYFKWKRKKAGRKFAHNPICPLYLSCYLRNVFKCQVWGTMQESTGEQHQIVWKMKATNDCSTQRCQNTNLTNMFWWYYPIESYSHLLSSS